MDFFFAVLPAVSLFFGFGVSTFRLGVIYQISDWVLNMIGFNESPIFSVKYDGIGGWGCILKNLVGELLVHGPTFSEKYSN